jgi:hypothetical protein
MATDLGSTVEVTEPPATPDRSVFYAVDSRLLRETVTRLLRKREFSHPDGANRLRRLTAEGFRPPAVNSLLRTVLPHASPHLPRVKVVVFGMGEDPYIF